MMNTVMINSKPCRMDGASPNFITCISPAVFLLFIFKKNDEGTYDVLVTSDGIPAICKTTCTFEYKK